MVGIIKILSLAIILCLCIVPLDIQLAPAPIAVGGHVVVEVVDAATHARIPDATVAVYYNDTQYFAGHCVRTNESMLVTEWAHDCGDELLIVAWHEDYYLNDIQYTVPYFNDPNSIAQWYFMAHMELFKKSINVTADIYPPVDGFPINVSFDTETYLGMTITVPEENGVFGMTYDWVNLNTDYEYSKGVVIVSSNRILEMPHKYEWQTVHRFYYAFEIGRLYGGNSVIRIPVILFQDCEIGISIVDTVKLEKIYMSYEIDGDIFIYVSDVTLSYRHYISTFSYVNETLSCVGDVQMEYGYQPMYIYPAGYTALEDLRIIWDIPDTGRRSWWLDIDWADLYISAVLVVCVIFIVYVAYWPRKNTVDPGSITLCR